MLVGASGGCGQLERWLDDRVFPMTGDAVVVGIDPGYPSLAPMAPYDGPYPGDQAFRLAAQTYPVRIGEVGPVDRSLGPPQQPFLCTTEVSGLGQPIIDNQQGFGVPVYAQKDGRRTATLLGYSQDCAASTRAGFYYKPRDRRQLRPLPATGEAPRDAEMITWAGGTVPFVVRVEQGTINRFIYTIAVPADPQDWAAGQLAEPTADRWNGYLVYQFGGGINIGKNQGHAPLERVLGWRLNDLAKGYAIAFSTGTETGTHYNMRLAGNTARMVKRQFAALYGAPQKTIGMGASGGAAMQYLLAESRPGLLDALIPVYGYPDVATQTIWALDCELLEHYFDVTARDRPRWRDPLQRTLVEGLSANREKPNPYNVADGLFRLMSLRWPAYGAGATECSIGWRAPIPLTDNPIGFHFKHHYAPAVRAATRFSHWHDLKHIYGVDSHGYAFRTFDNVGVQYGLVALRNGQLSMTEFLHLNANIGGWRPPAEQTEPRYWLLQDERRARRFSMWSEHNMTDGQGRRAAGHLPAMQAAYRSGQVFLGRAAVPVLDVRHYLDPYLDIHHSFASLSARRRIERVQNAADRHRIWVAEAPVTPSGVFRTIDFASGSAALNRLLDAALDAVRRWLDERADPGDACFDATLAPIAAGRGVWDGPWNDRPAGACTRRFPHYQSPRDAAGAPLAGDMFKCHLMPVAEAAVTGVYGGIATDDWLRALETVFPDGVCDYRRPDRARPDPL